MGRHRATDIELLGRLAKRRRWSAEDARGLLDALKRSGRTPEDFAARWGLPVSRVRRWQSREAPPRTRATSPIQFAELTLERPRQRELVVEPEPVALRLDLRTQGFSLLIFAPDRCAPAWLAELAAWLEDAAT